MANEIINIQRTEKYGIAMQFAIKQYDLTFIITKLIVVMMSTVLISMLTWIHGTSVKGNIIL